CTVLPCFGVSVSGELDGNRGSSLPTLSGLGTWMGPSWIGSALSTRRFAAVARSADRVVHGGRESARVSLQGTSPTVDASSCGGARGRSWVRSRSALSPLELALDSGRVVHCGLIRDSCIPSSRLRDG